MTGEFTETGNRRGNRSPAPKAAHPFIKWAGGKGQLLEQFEVLFPPKFKGYHEPFLGGGAVFFHLAGQLTRRRRFLMDLNPELINAYLVVRDNVELLIEDLKTHQATQEYYYKTRAVDPKDLSPVSRASRLIYLNRTCFNGLYRVNRKGQFNVPYGRYKNPTICDGENLRACSKILRKSSIRVADFSEVLEHAESGDFVYMDPPYYPLTNTAYFTDYTVHGFGDDEQKRLSDVYRDLDKRGCQVMLSNSDVPRVRDLYSGFKVITVRANRQINSKASLRGPVSEVVITNYEV